MADPGAFHQMLEAVWPADDPLQPGFILVAVLSHDRHPIDDLVQADALWIKSPRGKSVAAIHKAYRKARPDAGDFVLRHDFKVAPNDTKLETYTTRSNLFIALEALRYADMDMRDQMLLSTPAARQVISHHTADRSNSVPTGDDQVKLNERPDPSSVPSQSSATPAPQAASQSTPVFPKTIPQTSPPNAEELGWIDFCLERRELRDRNRGPSAALPPNFLATEGAGIADEWKALNAAQKSYFIQRIPKVLPNALPLAGKAPHLAFWSCYYNSFFDSKHNRGINHHASFQSTEQFFHAAVISWSKLDAVHRRVFVENAVASLSRWGNVPPSPDATTSATGAPPARLNIPDFSSLHAAPRSDNHLPELNTAPIDDGQIPRTCSPSFESDEGESQQGEQEANAPLEPLSNPTYLNELFQGCNAAQLERGVEVGSAILSQIRKELGSQPLPDSSHWLHCIETLQKQTIKVKTVVGVVGATGAGKSSVINAILDEERLVPTNCMRACTAVVTEISFNHEQVPYRAEIEFISKEDWHKMLELLFQDLINSSGHVSKECTNEESEAGIAYAQIKAVYPRLTKDEMAQVSIDQLMHHPNVSCLGTKRQLESDDASQLYKSLQRYVDSAEKNGARNGTENEKGKKKPREQEYWPLIKVCRLYVKAAALSTGAVIVDLPGVHDSNQARAAVAQGYMKQCTGLWIVAPITRAVDDKSAKYLLGDTFKRQLKMDGGYNSVTFICSKTDDISLTEAQDSLGLLEELEPVYARSDNLRKKQRSLKKQIDNLNDAKRDIASTVEDADDERDIWEALLEDCKNGKTVYRPKQQLQSKKRKASQKPFTPRKKSMYVDPDTDDEFMVQSSDSDTDDERSEKEEDNQVPLSEDDIKTEIAKLREITQNGRSEKKKIAGQISEIRCTLHEVEVEREGIDAELSAKCIAGRNEYSRGAIQQDFAAGIKELDMEIAQEEDSANFNPEVDVRDYDEVAKSLPVFCVSSRTYQRLKGRFEKDKTPPGFKQVEETEIPALQAHCVRMTEAGREATCRRFLASSLQLLNSLRLWSCNEGNGRSLSESQLDHEVKNLEGKLKKLDLELEKAVKDVVATISEELQDKVFDAFDTAVRSAKSSASDTADRWGSRPNRENPSAGGLWWSVYKATVRRDGCYTNATGVHNFNEQLAEPIIRHITTGWETVFSRRLPAILNSLSYSGPRILTKFHEQVQHRALSTGVSSTAFHMLKAQLPVYGDTFKAAEGEARTHIIAKQRDINREFVPVIREAMLAVYERCVAEVGPGQFNRMKLHMAGHVTMNKETMFDKSTAAVATMLQDMLRETGHLLLKKIDEIFFMVSRDYTSTIVGQKEAADSSLLPHDQRALRRAVLEIIDNAEGDIKKAVGSEEGTAVETAQRVERVENGDVGEDEIGNGATVQEVHAISGYDGAEDRPLPEADGLEKGGDTKLERLEIHHDEDEAGSAVAASTPAEAVANVESQSLGALHSADQPMTGADADATLPETDSVDGSNSLSDASFATVNTAAEDGASAQFLSQQTDGASDDPDTAVSYGTPTGISHGIPDIGDSQRTAQLLKSSNFPEVEKENLTPAASESASSPASEWGFSRLGDE